MYAKLFASIYQGTLRGNTHGLVVFTNMLAHADAEGWVDIHPRAIAEETGLTIEQVNAAIHELESPDTDSRSPEEEGRRIVRLDEHRAWGWRVVNHGKYRSIRSEEDRREQNRLAQERWRNKHKPSVSIDKQDKPKQKQEAEAYKPKTIVQDKPLDDFDIFWKAYPRKEAKADAMKAWVSPKIKIDLPAILKAIETRKAVGDWDDVQFIPLPASWLRGERWNDEILPPTTKTKLSTVVPAPIRVCSRCNEPATYQLGSSWYCSKHDQYSPSEAK